MRGVVLAARSIGWVVPAGRRGGGSSAETCTCSSLGESALLRDVVLGARDILAAVKHWHRHGQHRLGCVDIGEIRGPMATGLPGATGGTAAAVPAFA
jgi:hypothetical protein